MNRQCGGGKFKYVPKFCIEGTGDVISRMRNDDLRWSGTLELNISKTAGDTHLVTLGVVGVVGVLVADSPGSKKNKMGGSSKGA